MLSLLKKVRRRQSRTVQPKVYYVALLSTHGMHIQTYSQFYEGNTFLIEAEKNAIVDLGSLETAKRIAFDEICCIILTHVHYDHTAALGHLKLGDKTVVMMHEADAKAIGSNASAAHFFGGSAPQFHVDTLLKDGMEIELGDITLQVIHTPGHTPGSICLHEAQSKSLFSGDTIFPQGSIGRTDLPGGNPQDIVRSISKIAQLDITTLYPGHGAVTADNVNEQIKQSLMLARAIQSFE